MVSNKSLRHVSEKCLRRASRNQEILHMLSDPLERERVRMSVGLTKKTAEGLHKDLLLHVILDVLACSAH